MSIASNKVVPEDMRTSIIRVYNYQDKNLQGTFCNPCQDTEVVFTNLTQLLLGMENLMDKMDCPQPATRSRRFKSVLNHVERASVEEQLQLRPDQEILATFKVKVLFRQGASWQGRLGLAESGEEVSFRSVLELILLLDSALGGNGK